MLDTRNPRPQTSSRQKKKTYSFCYFPLWPQGTLNCEPSSRIEARNARKRHRHPEPQAWLREKIGTKPRIRTLKQKPKAYSLNNFIIIYIYICMYLYIYIYTYIYIFIYLFIYLFIFFIYYLCIYNTCHAVSADVAKWEPKI